MDTGLTINPSNNGSTGGNNGNALFGFFRSSTLNIDFDQLNDISFLNSKGVVEAYTIERVVIHEIIHALRSLGDNYSRDLTSSSADFRGDTVNATNAVMRELGAQTDRAAYVSLSGVVYNDNGDTVEVGTSFTEGNEIDVAYVTPALQSGNQIGGSSGRDLVLALDGDDTITMSAGNDYIYGGRGVDTVDFKDATAAITVEINQSGKLTVSGGFGSQDFFDSIEKIIGTDQDDTFKVSSLTTDAGQAYKGFDGGDGDGDTLDLSGFSEGFDGSSVEIKNFEKIIGTDQDDTIEVDGDSDTEIEAKGGNDTITGADGDDKLDGGEGNDDLKGGAGDDTIDGGEGDDTIDGGDGNDTIKGDAGKDDIKGGAGNDAIEGGEGDDTIDGGAGNDELKGGAGSDTIDGGAGNDTLDGGDGSDTLTGGAGNDTYRVGNGDTIEGGSDGSGDSIFLDGTKLTGPKDEDDEEGDDCPEDGEGPPEPPNTDGPWEGEDGATYSLSGNTLTVTLGGSSITINGFSSGDYGFEIPEEEETDDGNGDADCNRDPLVIDLDGDGLEFVGQYDGAYYDYGNDGFADRTAWVGADDGLIVRDLNGDGRITGDAELFNTGFGSLANLAALDENEDGVVDANDSGFADLLVWQDANTNGITDEGELRTLTEIGVESLAVDSFGPNTFSGTEGVTIFGTTTATMSGGSTAIVGGVGFAFNDHITRYLGTTEADADVADLPYLNGYGTTRDLDIAMTEDQGLQNMVEALAVMSTADAGDFAASVEQIMLRWHRAEDAVEDGRGNYTDGQHLEVVEDVFGNSFSNSNVFGSQGNPRVVAGSILTNSWNNYYSNTAARLFAQSELGAELFPELGYYAAAVLQVDDGTSVSTILARMDAAAPESTFEALAFWKGMSLVLNAVREQFTEQGEAFTLTVNAALAASGLELSFDQLVESVMGLDGGDVMVGRAGDDPNGFTNDDLFISGTGDDTIIDYGGEDTIIYGEGRGNDVFEGGYYSGSNKTIRLVDLGAEDISITFSDPTGTSVVITILATGETLTLSNIAREGVLRTDVLLSFDGGVNVDLSDNLTFDIPEATDGDDDIAGSVLGDTLDGGAGNDSLDGGRGGDTYIFEQGGGADTITDSGTDVSSDVVQVNANFADVTTDYNNGDFIITLADGSALTVVNGNTTIESFVFLDQTFTGEAFTTLLFDQARTQTGTDGDDTLTGTNLPDIIVGGLGNDTLTGGNGNDEFYYASGDGIDFIDNPGSGTDILYVSGYSASDATISQDPDNAAIIVIAFSETDQIRIDNYLSTSSFELENIVFDDGTEITKLDVRDALIAAQVTDGDDEVTGFNNTDDVLYGGLGNDRLVGGSGNDTYIFNQGDGNDVISDTSGSDILTLNGYNIADAIFTRDAANPFLFNLNFQGATDSVVMENTIESFEFDDGVLSRADVIASFLADFNGNADGLTWDGFSSADTYESGAGDDQINDLFGGDDTYIFRSGDGNDVISDERSSNDTLILEDHNLEDVTISLSGTNMLITFNDSATDSITVTRQFAAVNPTFFNESSVHTIENIQFADGSILNWRELDDIAFLNLQTDGDDTINGFAEEQTLYLGAGNDTLVGRYADLYIRPEDASGDDRILDNGIITTDRVILEGVNSEDVTFALDNDDIVITFVGASSGTLRLDEHFDRLGWHTIEFLEFGDGEVYRVADMLARIITVADVTTIIDGTEAAETLTGTDANERIDGGAGDDTLTGGAGSDVYVFTIGSGNDTIIEGGGSARLNVDRVVFEGLNPDDVEITRGNNGNNNLLVEILATGETLTIQNQLSNGNGAGSNSIEQFIFEDGTTLTFGQIFGRSFIPGTDGDDILTSDNDWDTLNGFAGNDTLNGEDGNDTLIGGLGDDSLDGGDGNDTYIYNLGDGNDTISERFSDGTDTLIVNGINFSDVVFRVDTNSFGDDLWLELPDGSTIFIADQNDVSTLGNGNIRYNRDVINNFTFDDGEFTRDDVFERSQILGTDGADSLSALSFSRFAVAGGLGDDNIVGAQSSGPILWSQGDGNDTISGITISDNMGSFRLLDVASTDAEFARIGDDLTLTITQTGEIITFEDYFIFDGSNFRYDQYNGPGRFEFTDVTISRNDIYTDIPFGTASNDFIEGGARADVINGAAGVAFPLKSGPF